MRGLDCPVEMLIRDVTRYRTVSTENHAFCPGFRNQIAYVGLNLFLVARIKNALATVVKAADYDATAKQFLALAKRVTVCFGGPVDYLQRIVGEPFQMIGGAIESADVQNVDFKFLINSVLHFQINRLRYLSKEFVIVRALILNGLSAVVDAINVGLCTQRLNDFDLIISDYVQHVFDDFWILLVQIKEALVS